MEYIFPERRMKLSRVEDMNDPFELLAAQLTEMGMRRLPKALHAHWARTKGVICFSDNMRSPLMWAHYAEKHCGVCLGFEIPAKPEDFDNSIIRPINYEPKGLEFELAKLQESEENRLSFIRALLHTKAADWTYGREYRTMADLDDQDPTTKYYYVDFSANMVLREVIIGCRGELLPPQVAAKLRGLPASVRIYKARAGFDRFEMVRDKKIPIVNVLAKKR